MYKKKTEMPHLLRLSFKKLTALLATEIHFQLLSRRPKRGGIQTGVASEIYFREQFSRYIPPNYAISSGTIIDTQGYGSGDCDMIIYDERYAHIFWLPSGLGDRRIYIPVESTYAVFEVKENLTKASLKEACQKVISYKELYRKPNHQLSAYSHLPPPSNVLLNPAFGIIFCYLAQGYGQLTTEKNIEKLKRDFIEFNSVVPLHQRVNGLFVNGIGHLSWIEHKLPNRYIRHYFPERSSKDNVEPHWIQNNEALFEMYRFLRGGMAQIHLLPSDPSDYDNLLNDNQTSFP